MRGFLNSLALSMLTVLAVAGAALAQGGGEPAPQAVSPGDGQSTEAEESAGIFGRLRAGVVWVFARERLRVHVNGAYQRSSRQAELETAFRTYGEQARFLTRERFRGGGHVDAGGALRIWRGLAFGVSYTQMNSSGSAVVTGTIPHPIDAGRDRSVPMQELALLQQQRATHAYAAWSVPLLDRLDVQLSGGPTYFNLRQGVVGTLTPSEASGPPFADVGLKLDAGEHTRNGAGFNASIDITYRLSPAVWMPGLGVGYFARVTRGSVAIPINPGSSRNATVGGVQTGVGLRLVF